ncbi:filamentous hemagglutinin N-terminal domain-containing protein [Nostoc sp. NMS8]|uniref:two-partner secretion domain-containing protein n=1 Tax=Nostoc sp. NMS8 TaxID=2815392 RepID=UPI0025FAD024|nr:filamentous hemagglutinin N-terminal domain-containing protein [Nostoc sp. NMS8]MBN3958723.1 filamentous hemagglutinin N-terminal domain-containing protein [Nostoc sp. NMS8]
MMPQQNLFPKFFIFTLFILGSIPAQAQITPDNTLGAERSNITPNVLINGASSDLINGGAIRGSNLFHSFTEFNIGDGQRVYFGNPSGIENILTRVTGVNRSNILGTLGVNGAANLFLINPNGILFGQNARLDVRGSFVGTTANGVQFGNQGNFSATNPQAPPLLTIQPSALLFNVINQNAAIQNNSVEPTGILDPAGFNVFGLRVPDGKSLLLVGGNVSMNGGELNAYGGRVELGGLTESGNVNLLFDGDNLKLGFPENVTRADVSLTNQARVYVEAAGGGDIAINARNLEILQGSELSAGIGQGLGTPETVAGDITFNATGEIKVAGSGSRISNLVRGDSKGNGGNIFIDSGSLSLGDGTQISASTFGKGNAGNVTVRAKDAVSLVGGDIFNTVESGGVGNAENIDINTGSLSLTNGAQINSFTRGRGNAGNITIQARAAVTFDKVDSDGFSSGSFSSVLAGGVGNSGKIKITAGSLFLTNNGQLDVSVRGASDTIAAGEGIGGTVDINVRDTFTISGTNSGIFANLGAGAVGRGGDITIKAGEITVENSGTITSETYGKGDTGDITINTRNLIVRDSQLGSVVHDEGNAGNVKIIASDSVELSGEIPGNENGFPGGILAQLDVTGKGKGGNLYIETKRLSVSDGSKVQAATFGQGDAGNLFIRADDIDVFETEKPNFYSTGIFAGVQFDPRTVKLPQGNGGDLRIETRNLSLQNGGEIGSSTSGKGDSGNIFITASDAISLDTASYIYNNVESRAEGDAGKIDITTGSLSVTNGAQINSLTRGRGNAGNITIQARDAVTFDGKDNNGNRSGLFSVVGADAIGNGGTINITTGSLFLNNGGTLGTYVSNTSDELQGKKSFGGTANINVRDAFTISGKGSGIFASIGSGVVGRGGDVNIEAGNLFIQDTGEISSFLALGAEGRGGDINIQAGNLFIKDDSEINSSIYGRGNAGNISITARDAIFIDSASYIYNNVGTRDALGNAGKIDITTGSLTATNGAQINSFTRGRGNAGNITIQARDAVTFDGLDSDEYTGSFSSVETGAIGNGGSINITSGSLSLINSGILGVSVDRASEALPGGQGIGGNININVRDAFTISGTDSGIDAFLGAGAVGKSGDVNIQAGNLFIKDGGAINSSTYGKGNAGNITVEAKDLVEILNDSNLDSDVQQGARGNAGDITIKTGRLIVRNSQIGPSVFGEGNAGNFTILASDSVELSGQINRREGDTSQEGSVGFPGGLFAQVDALGKGRAGNLTIETRRLSVSDGSKIQAATFGDGDAGNVFIRADEIDLFETEKPNFYNAGIFAGVQTDGRVDAGIIDPRNGRPPKGQGGNLTIETRKLSVRDGAEVFVQTTGEGDAGKISIRASESVNVTGVSKGSLERQRTSEITAGASQRSTGNGGSLTIETPLLNVADGGIISSSSQGKGTAGDINITADVARLNNGQITAQTASTDGGNIDFNLSQYLLLRNGSQISTTAGTAQAGGDGGNITINTPFIVAVPNENSDITANAFSGKGGNINISTQSLFGIEPRPKLSDQTNDITASSELGVQGQIAITQPEVQPTQGLIQLPDERIDASNQIGQICPKGSYAKKPLGEFIVSGRGSLPPNPLQSITGTPNLIPLATLAGETATPVRGDAKTQRDAQITPVINNGSSTIIEAQGFARTPEGKIIIVAYAPKATPSSRPTAAACPANR